MYQEEIRGTRNSKTMLRICTGICTVTPYLLHQEASQAICPDAFESLRTRHQAC